jgi:type I restriction enzyme S subunit
MYNWRRVDEIITYYGKGVTPKYVTESSIIVLNQKCIRNNKIDFAFAQFIDDSKDYNKDKFLKIGDLLINSTGQGTAGRVALVDNIPEGYKLIVDSHILVLRTNNYYESKCLNYSLFSIESLLQTFMDGSTGQGEFDKIRLFNINIGYPKDNRSQKKIASVLSALDDKIELNNKINAELEAMAKTLYDYWFVQFDFPNAEGKPYKSSGGEMVYDEVLKREIPMGWEVKGLSDICQIVNGYAFKSEWYTEKGVKIIRTKNFKDGYVTLNDVTFIEEEKSLEFKKYYLNIFDFLMVMVGASTGKYSVVNSNILPALQNQNMWRFVTKMDCQIYLNLSLQDVILELENTTNGSARGFFQKETFLGKKIQNPPNNLLKKFEESVIPSFKKIDTALKQNQKLASLRDWLLPMLMNGQVKVVEGYKEEEEKLAMVADGEVRYGK